MEKKQKVDEARPAFIKVSESIEGVINGIQCGYAVYVADKKEGEKYFNYFIPSFNMHFFAETEEDGKIIGEAGIEGFFDYWVKNQGKKAFFDQIKKLGFVEVKSKAKKAVRYSAIRPSIPMAYNHKAFDISTTISEAA
ncbi:hypothetical protein [uncultured Mucilaginibacter sp.]|uniref:hypothetical protein n=1 Tax=uncultured Mucilaginibacter sp. TaxID=797541 RepID=UPI0025FC75A7|nr:hypothetical protein [uncultured Mucilaginibacter sp.]